MTTIEQAIADLDRPDIAEYLISKGIKGNPCKPVRCPVARYIAAQTGLEVSVAERAYFDLRFYDLPPRVQDFIGNFDCGAYPELVESPPI